MVSILRCSYHGGSAWAGRVEDVMRAVGRVEDVMRAVGSGWRWRVGSGCWEDLVAVVVGEDMMAAPAQALKSRMR